MPQAVIDVVLGLVQGLTEFLPVSSSGHLVVVPALFGWDDPSTSFAIVVHVGTLLAVVAYFRADLGNLAAGLVGRGADPEGSRRMIGYLALGTVPAAIAGLLFDNFFESLFAEPLWVCAFWVVTAAILIGAERLSRRGGTRAIDARTALLIGAAQAAAIAPGVSRAGATIAMGLVLGLSRTDAARFSFLLAIPAIAGGGLTLIPEISDGSFALTASVMAGFAVAAVSGYVAIAGLLRHLRTRSLAPFSGYLLVVAPAAAAWLWLT